MAGVVWMRRLCRPCPHSFGEHPTSAECGISKSINRRLVRQLARHELIIVFGDLKPGLESYKRTPVFWSLVSVLFITYPLYNLSIILCLASLIARECMLTRSNCARLLSYQRGKGQFMPLMSSRWCNSGGVCVHLPIRWEKERRCVLQSRSWVLEKRCEQRLSMSRSHLGAATKQR